MKLKEYYEFNNSDEYLNYLRGLDQELLAYAFSERISSQSYDWYNICDDRHWVHLMLTEWFEIAQRNIREF